MPAGIVRLEALVSLAYKPVRRRWDLVTFQFFGALGFVAAGLWMVFIPKTVMMAAAGLLSIVFFGFVAILVVWRVIADRRLYVGSGGIGFGSRGTAPKLIPWRDIEHIGLMSHATQAYVVLTLSDYTAYLAQFSDREARSEVRKLRFAMGVGAMAQSLGGSTNRYSAELAPLLAASAGARQLADVLALYRQHFGGEILLTMYDRDREPEAFARYLDGLRARNSR